MTNLFQVMDSKDFNVFMKVNETLNDLVNGSCERLTIKNRSIGSREYTYFYINDSMAVKVVECDYFNSYSFLFEKETINDICNNYIFRIEKYGATFEKKEASTKNYVPIDGSEFLEKFQENLIYRLSR